VASYHFSFLPAGSTATSVPSTPITAASALAASIPGCTVTAYAPTADEGLGSVTAAAHTSCGAYDDVFTSVALYWSNTNSPFSWVYQGSSNTFEGTQVSSASYVHSCTRNTTHWWHSLNSTKVVEHPLAGEYAETKNSNNVSLHCT
jgi:hypothetical protein